MNIKVDFDNIVVKEDKNDFNVKVLMLKGEKGDQGDGEPNVIESVQVNGTPLPVTNKAVNVLVPTIDSTISSSSTNPVQNNTIYNALSNKVDTSELNNYYEISEVDNLLNKKPYIFNSVSEMKAYNLQESDSVITMGYYSSGDNGGAEYVIKPTSNNYYENLNNGLVAELVIKEPLNVRALGLNNTDDCSTQLQSIIDLGVKNLFFPAGTYHFDSEINTKEIQWELDNNAEMIASDTIDYIISINPSGSSRIQNMYIRGGKFNGNGKADVCIKLNKSQYFRFEDIFITNFLDCGIEFDNGYSGGTYVKNCILWGISDNEAEIGIDLNTNGDCHIIDCGFKDCKTAMNIRGGDIKVVGCHAWCNSETKYIGSKFADVTGAGRTTFDHCVLDTMQYGVYGGNTIIFTSLVNTIFMNRSAYGENNIPVIIYSETSFNNYSGINMNGLLISANTGKVKIISDSLLSQKDVLEHQTYNGLFEYQESSNIEILNNPKNTNEFSYKTSYAGTLNRSSNYDNLTRNFYQVNTWTGSGGTNVPGTDFTGVLYNVVNSSTNNDKNNGFQLVFTSTGKLICRYKKGNVWSAWNTFNKDA